MTKILVFTDFDGTVTHREGAGTVFSEFYQSLLDIDESLKGKGYKDAPMKEDLQSLFEQKFGEYKEDVTFTKPDADMLMSADAAAFFREALSNPEVKIHIVTRNRRDYIIALFKYQGFSQQEIENITIMDSGVKYNDVKAELKRHRDKADFVYVLDDNLGDYTVMKNAVTDNHYAEMQICGGQNRPGEFTWKDYQKELQQFFKPLPVTSKETSALAQIQSSGIALSLIQQRKEELQPEEDRRKEELQRLVEKTMDKVNNVLRTLEENIGAVDQHHFPKAVQKANYLLTMLRSAAAEYNSDLLSGMNRRDAGIEFKNKCEAAIDDVKSVLNRDLSWGDYLTNLLKKIANVVIRVFTANPNALFTPVRSASLDFVEDFAERLEMGDTPFQTNSLVH